MKKLMFIAISLILLLSACSQKPMTEEEKIRAVNEIFYKGKEYKIEDAAWILKETEEALGISEFKGIWRLYVHLMGISDTVCYEAMDGTEYYALYSDHTVSQPTLRLIRKDYYNGETIWNRAHKESSIKILDYNKSSVTYCLTTGMEGLNMTNHFD